MDRSTLDKGNRLLKNINFLQQKSDALYQACCTLIQDKTEAITEDQITTFVKKLMESLEGIMALTDIVKHVNEEYKYHIEEYQKQFDEL